MKLYTVLSVFLISFNTWGQNPLDTLKDPLQINQVVVSANRVEEIKRNISQQIESVSGKELEQLNFQNTADILANTGLLSVQKSQQGGGSPVIRGLEASRVLILVDGVRMNNLIYRVGHLQNVITVDENTLERVEVLFGPASTVYGSDALGGVINLYTKNPELKDTTDNSVSGGALVRYSSVNKGFKAHVDLTIASKRWAKLASFTVSDFNDLRMGSRQNGNNLFFGGRPYYVGRINGGDSLLMNNDSLVQKFSGYRQYDLMQKVIFQQSSHIKHLVNVQFSTTTDIPRYDRLTDPTVNGLKYAEWYYGPQKRLLVGYNFYGQELFAGQNLHIGLHYQNIEESRHQRRFGRDELQHRVERVNVVNFNTDLNTRLGNGQLRYGIEVEYDQLKSTAEAEDITIGLTSVLDTRYPDGHNSMFHSDGYATYTSATDNKLIWNAGLRFGYSSLSSKQTDTSFFRLPYSDIQQENFTYCGSTGAVYYPWDNLKLFVNMGSGYRVPNIDDLSKIFESAPGSLIVPNENLKPEKSITADAGFTLWLDQVFRFENTLYYTRIFDAIVTADYNFNGADSVLYDGTMSKVLANQNLRHAFIYGYSGNITVEIPGAFELYGGINYTYGRISSDSTTFPLDHIPPVYGSTGFRYSGKKLYIDGYALFSGKKNISDYYLNGEDNEQYAPVGGMPGWFTLNFKASYAINKLFTLQAGIENILDIQYRVFASGINAPGRNIYGTVRFGF
jgi:hemoglobin/transferrin/lactoferrin receptor protein